MSVLIKRDEEHVILAKMEKPPTVYTLSINEITIEGFTMTVYHVLVLTNGNPQIFYIFNRITMEILCEEGCSNNEFLDFSRDEDDDPYCESVRVFHDEPHLIAIPNISNLTAYHCRLDGCVLAGSNTFDDGGLCLGDSYSPYDLGAINLLCNYKANADLAWRGGAIQIEKPTRNNQRMVKDWPTMGCRQTIPPQIKEFFNH